MKSKFTTLYEKYIKQYKKELNSFVQDYENNLGYTLKPRKEVTEGMEDAPNYRKAEQKDGVIEPKCTSCAFNDDGRCSKYNFIFDPQFTCDSWKQIS